MLMIVYVQLMWSVATNRNMQFHFAVPLSSVANIRVCGHTLKALKDETLCFADSGERHMERSMNLSDDIEIQQVT